MLCCSPALAAAQQMEHSAPSPSTHLTIKTYEGKTLTLSPEELAALPHKSLADLLSKVGVPLGESLRGKVFLTGVVASGVDGYDVPYSLAEVDPSIHTGDVIVADTVDGKNWIKTARSRWYRAKSAARLAGYGTLPRSRW
jgi:hypothetical protein